MTLVDPGAVVERVARTQGAPICRHMGATEDVGSAPTSATGQHSLHLVRASWRLLPGASPYRLDLDRRS
jgi:hypothetical protein